MVSFEVEDYQVFVVVLVSPLKCWMVLGEQRREGVPGSCG